MSQYISSIVNLYGDEVNVAKDTKVLNEILARQGNNLLIHVISENIGRVALKHNLSEDEVTNAISKLVTELVTSIRERT